MDIIDAVANLLVNDVDTWVDKNKTLILNELSSKGVWLGPETPNSVLLEFDIIFNKRNYFDDYRNFIL